MALPPREEYKFDVGTLANDLGLTSATVRVILRKANVEKAGRSYGWNTQKEYDAVLKTLKSTSSGDTKPTKAPKAEKTTKGKARVKPKAA